MLLKLRNSDTVPPVSLRNPNKKIGKKNGRKNGKKTVPSAMSMAEGTADFEPLVGLPLYANILGRSGRAHYRTTIASSGNMLL